MSTSELVPSYADPRLDDLADLREFAEDPSAVLALNAQTATFRGVQVRGFIAYRRWGRWLVQIGGAYAADDDRLALIEEFRRFAAGRSCRVVAVQLQRRDAEEHRACGYTVNQLGASYGLALDTFSLRGRHYMQLRNKISRARRAGLEVQTTTVAALGAQERREIADLDARWLRSKGRFTKPLRFMVGELGGPAETTRRLVIGRIDGRLVNYLSLSPVFGSRPGWLHDLSRRSHDAPPGVMELLVLSSIEASLAEGSPWWHFGFTPFTALDPVHELPGASPTVTRLVRLLAERGAKIYPAASQVEYKQKWGDLTVLPDYLAFDGRPSLTGIVALMKVANLI